MAIFGKNGLWAAAIYLGSLVAVYNRKKVTYKDDKEIDALPSVAFRKSLKGKSKSEKESAVRAERAKKYPTGKDYSPEFKKAYEEAKWAR